MNSLRKWPGEELARPFNWTPRLKTGDGPTGTPTIAVSPSGLAVTYDSTEGALTWLRFEGGTSGQTYRVLLTTSTISGEIIQSDIDVIVR